MGILSDICPFPTCIILDRNFPKMFPPVNLSLDIKLGFLTAGFKKIP